MGSDLFSNYSIEKTPFLQGGYMKLWKIYHGTHKVRKQEVCIFVFEKKGLEKFPKHEQPEILLTLKCEAHTLVKFKHPSLLSVVESFVEDKNTNLLIYPYILIIFKSIIRFLIYLFN